MSNSTLSCMRRISPFRNSPRNNIIDTITIHCVVGQMSVEGLCAHFQTANCSCNYGIGPDGRICTIVDESDRSWCSSNAYNDNRAITIECASDAFYPYAINANVWKALINLCTDICKRNNIKRLVWSTDKYTRVNHLNGSNLTVHRDYDAKSCPGDYIYGRLGQIAKEINQKLSNTPTEPFKPYQGQVNADDGLNCRTSPVNGNVIKTYPDGTVFVISKEDGNWGYNGEGWVCLDYVNKIASAKDPDTKEEVIMDSKMFEKFYAEKNPTYNTLEEIPDYWRDDVKELVEMGVINGVGGGKLGLTHSEVKAAIIVKRFYDKKNAK